MFWIFLNFCWFSCRNLKSMRTFLRSCFWWSSDLWWYQHPRKSNPNPRSRTAMPRTSNVSARSVKAGRQNKNKGVRPNSNCLPTPLANPHCPNRRDIWSCSCGRRRRGLDAILIWPQCLQDSQKWDKEAPKKGKHLYLEHRKNSK